MKHQLTQKLERNLIKLFLIVLSISLLNSQPIELKLDHITISVSDLHESAELFGQLGFNLKEGRLHQNSIQNKFIEFADETEIELITATEKKDKLSGWYVDFITKNPDGKAAFIAFSITDLNPLIEKLQKAKLPFITSDLIYAKLISFSQDSEFHPLFFIKYNQKNTGNKMDQNHKNGVIKIKSVWLNKRLKGLFSLLGFSNYKTELHSLLGTVDLLTIGTHKLLFSEFSEERFFGISFLIEKGNNQKVEQQFGIYLEFISQ